MKSISKKQTAIVEDERTESAGNKNRTQFCGHNSRKMGK